MLFKFKILGFLTLFSGFFLTERNLIANPYPLSYIENFDGGLNSFEELKRFITEKKVNSIDELLAKFREHPRYREFLKSYTLIYDSRSAFQHAIDAKLPRVISHSKGLFLGFTGNAEHENSFNAMEIIEWNPKEKDFRFHKIELDPESKKVTFSTNPQSCSRCHGSPPRPIWGGYPLWPGAFGGMSDVIKDELNASFHANYEKERSGLKLFLKNQKGHARYKQLDPKTFESGEVHVGERPNLQLLIHLYSLNFARILNKIRGTPDYERFKFAILGTFVCGYLDDHQRYFFPNKLRIMLDQNILRNMQLKKGDAFHELEANTRKHLADNYMRRAKRMSELHDDKTPQPDYAGSASFAESETPITAGLRYIFEGRDISIRDWSLSFEAGRKNFSYNFFDNGAFYPVKRLFTEEIMKDVLLTHPHMRSEPVDCTQLAETSRKALESIADTISFMKEKDSTAAIQSGTRGSQKNSTPTDKQDSSPHH